MRERPRHFFGGEGFANGKPSDTLGLVVDVFTKFVINGCSSFVSFLSYLDKP